MADIKAEYLACPIRQVVSRFGDKWSMLVLYMLDPPSDDGLFPEDALADIEESGAEPPGTS